MPAKTWDDPNNAWSGAATTRRWVIADAIMIMTYDEHWSGGSAGPVASIGLGKRVVGMPLKKSRRENPPGHRRLRL